MEKTYDKHLEEIMAISKNELVDVLATITLRYYNNYKEDKDSLEQVYNAVFAILNLRREELHLLFDDVTKTLEKKYFYKIESENPLILKSIL